MSIVKKFERWIPTQFQGVGSSGLFVLSTDVLFQELSCKIAGQQTSNWLGAEDFNVLDYVHAWGGDKSGTSQRNPINALDQDLTGYTAGSNCQQGTYG